MLYFQVVILAATLMLVYYCEFTDTFSPVEQGFICRDPALTKPDPGPEQDSRIQPVILYSVVGGLPVVLVSLDTLAASSLLKYFKRQPVYTCSGFTVAKRHFMTLLHKMVMK